MNKVETPDVKAAGKAALKIIGVGLAAGVALIGATNTIMTKLTSKKETSKDEE